MRFAAPVGRRTQTDAFMLRSLTVHRIEKEAAQFDPERRNCDYDVTATVLSVAHTTAVDI